MILGLYDIILVSHYCGFLFLKVAIVIHKTKGKAKMKLQSVTKAEEMIQQILTDREHDVHDLNSQLEKDRAGLKSAQAEMDDATIKGNLKAYQKAKADRRNYEDSIEMNTIRLNNLQASPLISDVVYANTVKEIFKEFAEVEAVSKQKTIDLAQQMYDEAMSLQELANDTNKVLRRLQHDIFNDADRPKDSRGKILPFAGSKEVNPWMLITWAKRPVMSDDFNDITGKKGR